MKLINTVFLLVFLTGLYLLGWTVYKSKSVPTQYETTFLQNRASLDFNINKIKEDQEFFDKYCKIEYQALQNKVIVKIIKQNPNIDIKTSNPQALLTTSYTNKYNKTLKAISDDDKHIYSFEVDNLNVAHQWIVEFRVNVTISADDINRELIIYKQIKLNIK